jgi:hypothetical protein
MKSPGPDDPGLRALAARGTSLYPCVDIGVFLSGPAPRQGALFASLSPVVSPPANVRCPFPGQDVLSRVRGPKARHSDRAAPSALHPNLNSFSRPYGRAYALPGLRPSRSKLRQTKVAARALEIVKLDRYKFVEIDIRAPDTRRLVCPRSMLERSLCQLLKPAETPAAFRYP